MHAKHFLGSYGVNSNIKHAHRKNSKDPNPQNMYENLKDALISYAFYGTTNKVCNRTLPLCSGVCTERMCARSSMARYVMRHEGRDKARRAIVASHVYCLTRVWF
jgi:hypothetical protein